jgi:hypothetical protein
MPMRKSTSFSNPNPSGLRSPRVESGVRMRRTKFEAHAEDERFQPAEELPLPISDCGFAKCLTLYRVTNECFRGRKGGLTHKDVKNEGRSDYMYENKARATKCHDRNAAFYTKMHPLHGNRQQSSGPFGRLCTSCATIRGEMTPATVVVVC